MSIIDLGVVTSLRVLWHFRPFTAEIQANNQLIVVKTLQIAVGNGRYYGGGMIVAEDAAIDDQKLDLYSLEVLHWWGILALFPAIKQGHFATRQCVRTLQAQEIEVYTPRRPRYIDADGELTTQTPARFRVIPQALSVFCLDQPNNTNV